MAKRKDDASKTPSKPDAAVAAGKGGETHQTASGDTPVLTTQQGIPVADDQNSLRVGARGPTLLEDFHFREKIFHFDHERIPERVVHARGYGAHGYFENYGSLADVTRADLFQRKGEKTPVFVRFSTVAGSKGSADLARDVRGFAVKFYTKQGNWDLVGNNIPVFFIQDAIKFPDLIHAAKPEPDRDFPQAQTAHDNFWDFISLSPESMHMIMWIMSDRTIPRSFRFMEGFGVHTFRLVNAEGKSTFVKFHWKPKQGLQSVVWNEAVKINGADPDFHRRDLWDAIEAGDFPEWELGVQLFDEAFAEKFEFDVLDATKIIPEEQVPVQDRRPDGPRPARGQFLRRDRAGRLLHAEHRAGDRLQQRPAAARAELLLPRHPAQAARRPELHPHPDQRAEVPVLALPAGRPHGDAQPQGAGELRAELLDRRRARVNPRSVGFKSYPEPVEGPKVRARSETFSDHYSQARQFYISQTEIEQTHIGNALTFELSKVETPAIRARMVSHLLNIDAGLAEAVAKGLRLKEMPEPATAARPTRQDLKPSPKLSIIKNGPKSFAGRKVGALVTDGVDAAVLAALGKALEGRGGDAQARRAGSRRREGLGTGRGTTPTRSSKAARPCSSMPSRSSLPRRVRRS